MKFSIDTMGCQMNKADSERVAGALLATGWSEADSMDQADMVLVNGCVVRAKAEQKALLRVRELLQRQRPPKVGLIGCAAQWRGAGLFRELPALHLMVSPSRLDELPSIASEGGCLLGESELRSPGTVIRRRSGIKAWIPVMHGCDHGCTFCVVPQTRGHETSLPPPHVMRIASEAVRAGHVELDLLGQRVSAYRYRGVTFAALVQQLALMAGVKRIRFTAPYPADVGDDLLQIMADSRVVEHRLHLPLQSGSDRVLARMGRGYTVSEYMGIVERGRSLMPDFGLSTDIIVGFPGETEADYATTERLVRDAEFDTAFTFMFSPRAGTPAAAMDGQIPHYVKKERLARLISVLHDTLERRLANFVGTTMEVLVERLDESTGDHSVGKASNGRVVAIAGRHAAGELVTVKVTGLQGHTLNAVPVDEGGQRCGLSVGS
ncbi:MiaB/RimO family radical SAM methylthiotransferase [Candidatus Fermentibacteria bacterium]|nr:MiaB/RimO family radical SAM methylthiotransferase [Candidatus Fermentibacteria bacterium]